MKKRTFLLSALAAGGALVVGWGLMPPRQRLQAGTPLPTKDGQVALNGWLRLSPDGTVGLVMPKSEMGQGTHTALAMLVAEELDCTISQIQLLPTPIDRIYGNVLGLAEGVPFHPDDQGLVARGIRWSMIKFMGEMGFMMTGGSSSVKDSWLTVREAAAMTRASIVNVLASQWSVQPEQIVSANGQFSHTNGKQISLAEVIKQFGAQLKPATQFKLKEPSQFKVIGQPLPRIEASRKVNGQAQFSIDTLVPGMLYAAVTMSPQIRGNVSSFDPSAAQSMAGVKKLFSSRARRTQLAALQSWPITIGELKKHSIR